MGTTIAATIRGSFPGLTPKPRRHPTAVPNHSFQLPLTSATEVTRPCTVSIFTIKHLPSPLLAAPPVCGDRFNTVEHFYSKCFQQSR